MAASALHRFVRHTLIFLFCSIPHSSAVAALSFFVKPGFDAILLVWSFVFSNCTYRFSIDFHTSIENSC
ncbi:hypothetical protein HanXRQr2_Chr09g0410741 [Helianthus annuus]|uniref:Secreted protein n=1 Tax=Helianthus annuus TaxID=4232 RepID=A0A9K3IAE7_HELAN|nr:hypothetical protein HanXRQr2_Chr09g0410741 [Helianthus annuus]